MNIAVYSILKIIFFNRYYDQIDNKHFLMLQQKQIKFNRKR